jgi:hypothetical protein
MKLNQALRFHSFPTQKRLRTISAVAAFIMHQLLHTHGHAARAQDNLAEESGDDDIEDVTLDQPTTAAEDAATEADAAKSAAEETSDEARNVEAAAEETAEVQQDEDVAEEQEGEGDTEEESETPAKTKIAAQDDEAPNQGMRMSNLRTGTSNRKFGSKRVSLNMHKPTFTEQKKLLDTLYGSGREYYSFGVDWFPLDWGINPGLLFSLGGFSWTGKAAVAADKSKPIAEDNLRLDENSKTSLLFLPIQTGFKIEMTPFDRKWVVFDVSIGYEYGWWQETRPTDADSVATSSLGLVAATSSTSTSTSDQPVLTSKGVSNATVIGASAHILLNGLDQRSARSMQTTMGLSNIYLTPFFQSVSSLKKGGYTFGRNVFGIGFTFESLR